MEVEKGEANLTLLRLPPEIIYRILSYLPCASLISLTRTCQLLGKHTDNEALWANLIRENISELPSQPFPFTTFRQLYLSHHPYWFLVRHRLWFSDSASTGKLIVVRYDPRRGSIEGYTILARKGEVNFQEWVGNSGVPIYSFEPAVSLHYDRPVIRLSGRDPAGQCRRPDGGEAEVSMHLGIDGSDPVGSSLVLSMKEPSESDLPDTAVWPPRTIPSQQRVRGIPHPDVPTSTAKLRTYAEMNDKIFRLRTWIQFTAGGAPLSVRMGDEISTWSTLDPTIYTPTEEKPYQGIWVGDYASHGCEFLLIMQRDTVSDEQYLRRSRWGLEWFEPAERSRNTFNQMADDPAYKGRIEAVKLTGDDNVPRGEYTWIANDIGSAGFIRVANHEPFLGARVVQSRGHIADRGFQNDQYIPSQLLLQSHDRLAHYWQPLGHVSYYDRVNIDALTEPST